MKATAELGSRIGERIEETGLILDSVVVRVVCPKCGKFWGIKVTGLSDLDNLNKFICLECLYRGDKK